MTNQKENNSNGGTKAVLTALLSNILIAVSKFVAFIVTASASMLAESIHSFADSVNQILLLFGNKQSKRPADDLHPFGYGREQYFYAFVVSLILFSIGGCFAILEAIEKIQTPHEVSSSLLLPLIILFIALILETFSLSVAIKESKPYKGDKGYFEFIKTAKNPELMVCLLEDTAAVVGLVIAIICLFLAHFTHNPLFDAIGSGLIGVLLICVAIILATEIKSLLIGESADPEVIETINREFVGGKIKSVIHNKVVHLSHDGLLVTAKVEFLPNVKSEEISAQIDQAEIRIREALPQYKIAIYAESDVHNENKQLKA
ncbi:MAG: cation diffusion facilitator family transporter [Methanobrevibacter sp.]|jgi:cation diffusion facilitator family transporter|nr:cation diffusion facilitator family transporter [Candidatus Methanoflexus mossambicus]